jgi:hypothetical protein
MSEIISFCGLDCAECPAYKAMKKDDPEARKKAAAEWSKLYNADIKSGDIFCVGCTIGDGKHFGHCAKCEYRACGQRKKKKNCANCEEYPCASLKKFHEWVPEAKGRLDRERAKGK